MFGYLAVAAGALFVPYYVISRRPSEFSIERSATIDAPREAVISRIVDFKQWSSWSPWDKLDPELKRTYSGAERGVGAIYEWVGNKKVGQGRMEIVAPTGSDQVTIDLQFIAPWRAHNKTVFRLTPEGNHVKLTWTMSGTSNFMSKLFSLVMNMDKVVGADFEKGLAELKRLSEQRAAA